MYNVINSHVSPEILDRITPSSNSPFLFENITRMELQYIANKSITKKFSAEQILFQQGDEAEYLYFIMDGKARTFRCSENGSETTIRMLESGETFMEAVLFMDGKSPISAQVLEDTEVMMIPKAVVKEKTMEDSIFAYNLLRIITQHYKNVVQQVDSICSKTPVQRVGYFLLKLRMDQVKHGDGLSDDIKLTFKKATIANHLNMTPETFSRALKKLQALGIRIEQDHIILENSFSLCSFCDPDMGYFCEKYTTDDCPIHY